MDQALKIFSELAALARETGGDGGEPALLALMAAAGVFVLALLVWLVRRLGGRRDGGVRLSPDTRLLESLPPAAQAEAEAFGTYQQFLAERGLPKDEIDGRMRETLDQFEALARDLRAVAPGDTVGEGLIAEAREVLAAGSLDRAAETLATLAESHDAAGRALKADADRRLMVAAAVHALMGDLMYAQTAYEPAARHYRDAVALLPPDETAVRTEYLNKHGTAAYSAAHFDEAADSFERALRIRERMLDANDPEVATALNNLAMVHYARGDYAAAEPLYKRALLVDEHNHGIDHPTIATDLNNLALLLKKQGNLEAAEPLLRRALMIKERVLPAGDPSLTRGLRNYAAVLRALKRTEEADRLEARVADGGKPQPPAPRAEPA